MTADAFAAKVVGIRNAVLLRRGRAARAPVAAPTSGSTTIAAAAPARPASPRCGAAAAGRGVLVVYIGAIAWTLWISFTSSRTLPELGFVGLRAVRAAVRQRALDGLGCTTWSSSACCSSPLPGASASCWRSFIDQKVRGESVLRTVFLYPYRDVVRRRPAWSGSGCSTPASASRSWCAAGVRRASRFDWIVRPGLVIYTLVIAAVWQASGLVMAIMLAGLRGIDEEIWKAARIDGIPAWRVYVSIVLPMLGRSFATAACCCRPASCKLYDPVVAMTRAAPASPARCRPNSSWTTCSSRANIGLASAGATSMLITVRGLLAPWLYWPSRRRAGGARDGRDAPSAVDGRKGRGRALTPARIGLYAFLRHRRAVLPAAALRDGRDLAEDDGRRSASATSSRCRSALTLRAPGARPGRAACTGLDCDGIRVGFWNSVAILVPWSILPILRRRAQRLRAVVLARRAAPALLFGVLMLGAFIPYQVIHLPAGAHLLAARHLRLAARHRAHPHRSSACRS